jgi:hypothetical protein
MTDIRTIRRDVLCVWKSLLRCVCGIIIGLHHSTGRSRSDQTIVLFQDIILEIRNKNTDFGCLTILLETFSEKLRERLEANAKDSNVAGFKTVVCYRTGLEVSTVPDPFAEDDAWFDIFAHAENSALFDIIDHSQSNVPLRLANKPLNDLVVRTTLEIAAEYNKPGIIPSYFSWSQHNVRF